MGWGTEGCRSCLSATQQCSAETKPARLEQARLLHSTPSLPLPPSPAPPPQPTRPTEITADSTPAPHCIRFAHLAQSARLDRHVAAKGWSLPGWVRHSDRASRNTSSALAHREHATSSATSAMTGGRRAWSFVPFGCAARRVVCVRRSWFGPNSEGWGGLDWPHNTHGQTVARPDDATPRPSPPQPFPQHPTPPHPPTASRDNNT